MWRLCLSAMHLQLALHSLFKCTGSPNGPSDGLEEHRTLQLCKEWVYGVCWWWWYLAGEYSSPNRSRSRV